MADIQTVSIAKQHDVKLCVVALQSYFQMELQKAIALILGYMPLDLFLIFQLWNS